MSLPGNVLVALLAPGLAAGDACAESRVALPSTSPASVADADPPIADCRYALLQRLGWRFEHGDGGLSEVHGGAPCERADLSDAHAHGDLRVRVPAPVPDGFAAQLDALLQHPATHCAHALQLGVATRRAVDKLVANAGFRFSSLQTGWIGFGAGGARRDGWEPMLSFERALRPAQSPSRAIEAFYAGTVRAECGVGRQVAQYATQLELFGAPAFDRAFPRDEIVIGRFNQLQRTRSVLLGSAAGEFTRDGRARAASRLGRQAFAGLPGFIVHVLDRSHLDDIHNQAENFVVYDVSAGAAHALRAVDGFEHYNRRAGELWSLSLGAGLSAHRIWERLLYERDATLLAAISPSKRARVRRMQAILDDPFFQGFRVYVHPKGVRPVGYHFARLLDRNPRTPFRIELGLHNLHTTLFRRWIEHELAQCRAGGTGAH